MFYRIPNSKVQLPFKGLYAEPIMPTCYWQIINNNEQYYK